MEQNLSKRSLMRLSGIVPRQPKELIKNMIKTGEVNLLGYYEGINITPVISALTAAVANGTTFAGQPSTTDSTVILLSQREPVSYMAYAMKQNNVNMHRVVVPTPAENHELSVDDVQQTIDYIRTLLDEAKDPALLIIDSLETVLKSEPIVLPMPTYRLLSKIAAVCADYDCALVVTSQVYDPAEDEDEEESINEMDVVLKMLDLKAYEPPTDCFLMTSFLKRVFIVGKVEPKRNYCLLEQPTNDPIPKLLVKFDIDENGKVIWEKEE